MHNAMIFNNTVVLARATLSDDQLMGMMAVRGYVPDGVGVVMDI
jgi:hypothetical protein